ncbi:LEM-3-like GIY-YIG domain-containing protein [Solidesulfovibrio magneticus]|uniref:GIY-YIG domain-containing protein n=1 Tax=Solidesulfovibrio magneticus (strain ATCC 700980 / DSM 13731 / RS-1) TaxID=573370 RepID=C4XJG3_SOLM1|nr:hypothetical protein [Solidesulfovibrio magneticus]BAH76713.1 hypothetical protein DMR_32220 [Solidesulfovibrio magneticus RS-1]
MFSTEVCESIKYYVYRLIDPRNGETFYVGKGKGNRVFQHASGEVVEDIDSDAFSQKIRRINEIKIQGHEVVHVIHRHGLDSETAYEIESALIDAYPGLTNIQGGKNSDDRGLMHYKQIIELYQAESVKFKHNALAININKSAYERENVYESVRYAWRLNPSKAKDMDIVLAIIKGLVVGVFQAEQWLEATPDNFPGTTEDRRPRWGFVGKNAPIEIQNIYLGRKVPGSSQNPVRYFFKDNQELADNSQHL